jgi:hypothetical protein
MSLWNMTLIRLLNSKLNVTSVCPLNVRFPVVVPNKVNVQQWTIRPAIISNRLYLLQDSNQ